jgi:hypothetical protein
VKTSRCSACSVTVCVQAGIDSWFKFRLFIGCARGNLLDRSFVDNPRRRCRITTRYDAKLIAE